ncbi:MAG: serine/threonine protein kinase [Propionibacteriales bacterium]|nr:serine/threonine protein kinase [Propionibacteriales bacterium]
MPSSTVPEIGRYRLDHTLGTGAFATVWLGHDPEFDLPVAVKVLADNWAHDADVRERFLAEARHLRTIRDPRIVSVHDIGTTDGGQPYFVMDLITGGTLADFRSHPVHGRYALTIGAECCLAVQALHDHGVLHRDIKPGNVLVDWRKEPPKVFLTDLGTAKLLAEATGYTVTTGTPAYMAPEQAHGLDGLDERADVYSLAAMTYELVSGHQPFQVRSPGALLDRRLDAQPSPIAVENDLPVALDGLLFRALATDREQRPRTAKDLADAFTALAAGTGSDRSDGPDITTATMGTAMGDQRTPAFAPAAPVSNKPRVSKQLSKAWPTGPVWLVAILLFATTAAITWLLIT